MIDARQHENSPAMSSLFSKARMIVLAIGPIVKCAHYQQLPTVQTREIVIVVNGQMSQWDQMSKINILQS